VHDFYANRIGIQLFDSHPIKWFVFTFLAKKIKKKLAVHLWQQIVWGFVWKIARVDSPLAGDKTLPYLILWMAAPIPTHASLKKVVTCYR
jgi:hypothetical protein